MIAEASNILEQFFFQTAANGNMFLCLEHFVSIHVFIWGHWAFLRLTLESYFLQAPVVNLRALLQQRVSALTEEILKHDVEFQEMAVAN